MPVTLVCQQCSIEFRVGLRLKDKARFCSRECRNASQRMPEEKRICAHCGESFLLPATSQVRARQLYCSRKCGTKAGALSKKDIGIRKFWSRVQYCQHGSDCPYCCHPYMGALTANGYGRVLVGGRNLMANRVAWELHNGRTMPDELFAAHYCHFPACCNVWHIHPATQKENMADSVRDRRHYYGERHHQSKLTKESIKEAFELRAKGWIIQRIADHLGVSYITIQKLLKRETWKYIDLEETPHA